MSCRGYADLRYGAPKCRKIGPEAGGSRTRAGRPMTGAMTAEGRAMSTHDLPQGAQIVIVGGGAVGCSVAYHLAKLGATHLVLLEQRQLACRATCHTARVVGTLCRRPRL